MTWACMLNILEFQRGLETRVGLPEALAWLVAPMALILLIALSIVEFVSFASNDKGPWWTWVGPMLAYLTAVFGYIAVAFGPSTFLE